MAQQEQQKTLWCRLCGKPEKCRGLCAGHYEEDRQDRKHLQGVRKRALDRDRGMCRVCGRTNVIVYRRNAQTKPGLRDLLSICRHCAPSIFLLHSIPFSTPDLIKKLWRERHPERAQQLDSSPQLELRFTARRGRRARQTLLLLPPVFDSLSDDIHNGRNAQNSYEPSCDAHSAA